MLSDQDKEHIRQEEIFREEVRGLLNKEDKATTFRAKCWRFVNTSFGIWLLSTVVVGLVSWGYANWSEAKQNDAKSKESIRKLDLELFARISNFENLLETATNR